MRVHRMQPSSRSLHWLRTRTFATNPFALSFPIFVLTSKSSFATSGRLSEKSRRADIVEMEHSDNSFSNRMTIASATLRSPRPRKRSSSESLSASSISENDLADIAPLFGRSNRCTGVRTTGLLKLRIIWSLGSYKKKPKFVFVIMSGPPRRSSKRIKRKVALTSTKLKVENLFIIGWAQAKFFHQIFFSRFVYEKFELFKSNHGRSHIGLIQIRWAGVFERLSGRARRRGGLAGSAQPGSTSWHRQYVSLSPLRFVYLPVQEPRWHVATLESATPAGPWLLSRLCRRC